MFSFRNFFTKLACRPSHTEDGASAKCFSWFVAGPAVLAKLVYDRHILLLVILPVVFASLMTVLFRQSDQTWRSDLLRLPTWRDVFSILALFALCGGALTMRSATGEGGRVRSNGAPNEEQRPEGGGELRQIRRVRFKSPTPAKPGSDSGSRHFGMEDTDKPSHCRCGCVISLALTNSASSVISPFQTSIALIDRTATSAYGSKAADHISITCIVEAIVNKDRSELLSGRCLPRYDRSLKLAAVLAVLKEEGVRPARSGRSSGTH